MCSDESIEFSKAEELVPPAPIPTPESGTVILDYDHEVADVENVDEKVELDAQKLEACEVETKGCKEQKHLENAQLTRSASDSQLETIVKEIDNELIDDEVDVRGVTKVTVNIAVSGGLN